MKIRTSKGSEFSVNWIWGPLQGTNQIMIDFTDTRSVKEIAAELEGCDVIEREDERRKGVKEVYEGYTEVVSVIRERLTSSVRVTLEKP